MRLVLITLALALVGCAEEHVKPYRRKSNLRYGREAANVYDFYEPIDLYAKHKRHRPLLIAIHGGSWYLGDKGWGRYVADFACREGWCVASVEYRLAPTHRWPAQYDDLQVATAHIMSMTTAGLDVDPNRVAVLGHSAGAMLAAHVITRTQDPRLKRGVLLAGHFAYNDVRDLDDHIARLMLGDPARVPDLTDEQRIDAAVVQRAQVDVNALLLHPIADPIASIEHSRRFYDALLRAGSQTSDFKPIASGDHNDFWRKPSTDGEHERAIVRWLRRQGL